MFVTYWAANENILPVLRPESVTRTAHVLGVKLDFAFTILVIGPVMSRTAYFICGAVVAKRI